MTGCHFISLTNVQFIVQQQSSISDTPTDVERFNVISTHTASYRTHPQIKIHTQTRPARTSKDKESYNRRTADFSNKWKLKFPGYLQPGRPPGLSTFENLRIPWREEPKPEKLEKKIIIIIFCSSFCICVRQFFKFCFVFNFKKK